MNDLTAYLLKHQACKEGRDYCLAVKADCLDDVWLRTDLPYHFRLWMFRKAVGNLAFIEFAGWCYRFSSLDPTMSERAQNAMKLFQTALAGSPTGHPPQLAAAVIEASWFPKEIVRMAWVAAYKTHETHPDYIKREDKKMTKWEACIKVCHDASEKVMIEQIKYMLERVPRITL